MPSTKLDYCIARFGRKRRYTARPPSGHSTYQPTRILKAVPAAAPTFLLAFMGSRSCMPGAVFTDKPIVQTLSAQPLTPLLWLDRVHTRKLQYREVTRLFAALSIGTSELEAFYSDLDFGVVSEARFPPKSPPSARTPEARFNSVVHTIPRPRP